MLTVDCSEERFSTNLDFSKFTENLKTPWLDDTWAIEFRTESRDNFGIGTNTAKRVGLAPSSWRPERLCYGKNLHLKICLDVSKGNQKGTFCEECPGKVDCSEPRQLFPDCSPLNCSEVNWGVFDAKADLLLPGVEGIFRYTSNSSDGQQVYKTDVGDTAKIRKDPNRKLVGSVEMGQRSFLIDSSFTDTWVESIDCEVSAWSEWSSCSKSCHWGDPGQSRRGRDVITQPTYGGASCPVLGETRGCNDFPCPVHCEVSTWSKWTSCSKPCGFGESQRARIIKREADNGGIPCPVLQATKSCNDFHCPVNCTVSAWSEWSSCSKSCHWGNPGQIRRGRDVLTQPTYGGASCPVLDDTKTCNDFPCPVDCKVRAWSLWSSCSKTCNSGQSRRGRVVETQPQFNGISCPLLEATKNCNDFPCPIDCQVNAWSGWSSCSKSCNWGTGPGKSRRGRAVVTPPEHGGASCPVLDGTQSCNDFPCPKHCGSLECMELMFEIMRIREKSAGKDCDQSTCSWRSTLPSS